MYKSYVLNFSWNHHHLKVICKYCQGGRTGHTDKQTNRQTNRIFGEGYFYVRLTHMNGFRAKRLFFWWGWKSASLEAFAASLRCLKNTFGKVQQYLIFLSLFWLYICWLQKDKKYEIIWVWCLLLNFRFRVDRGHLIIDIVFLSINKQGLSNWLTSRSIG